MRFVQLTTAASTETIKSWTSQWVACLRRALARSQGYPSFTEKGVPELCHYDLNEKALGCHNIMRNFRTLYG